MAENSKRSEQKSEQKPVAAAEEQVQQAMDEATEQGYFGVQVDTTPNEHYTVEGVTSGKPVPEAAADPVAARREAQNPDL